MKHPGFFLVNLSGKGTEIVVIILVISHGSCANLEKHFIFLTV